MNPEHRVLIAPGMDGRIGGIRLITRKWQERHGLTPEPIQITWKDNVPLKPKLDKVIATIDQLIDKGVKVSLVGCSAGGSLMLNAFWERIDHVYKVANLCGYIRPGTGTGFRSFEERGGDSLAFRQSVLRAHKQEPDLSAADRRRILTVRPLFDELVPGETVVMPGGQNEIVWIPEHILGISLALMQYDPLIRFLKD